MTALEILLLIYLLLKEIHVRASVKRAGKKEQQLNSSDAVERIACVRRKAIHLHSPSTCPPAFADNLKHEISKIVKLQCHVPTYWDLPVSARWPPARRLKI